MPVEAELGNPSQNDFILFSETFLFSCHNCVPTIQKASTVCVQESLPKSALPIT